MGVRSEGHTPKAPTAVRPRSCITSPGRRSKTKIYLLLCHSFKEGSCLHSRSKTCQVSSRQQRSDEEPPRGRDQSRQGRRPPIVLMTKQPPRRGASRRSLRACQQRAGVVVRSLCDFAGLHAAPLDSVASGLSSRIVGRCESLGGKFAYERRRISCFGWLISGFLVKSRFVWFDKCTKARQICHL
jgi:hypothetical protein